LTNNYISIKDIQEALQPRLEFFSMIGYNLDSPQLCLAISEYIYQLMECVQQGEIKLETEVVTFEDISRAMMIFHTFYEEFGKIPNTFHECISDYVYTLLEDVQRGEVKVIERNIQNER
jgi:hypothetical protein